jgi:hypothetical protein
LATEGLGLAEEPIRSNILRQARTRRFWVRPPVVVDGDDFVTRTEAGKC